VGSYALRIGSSGSGTHFQSRRTSSPIFRSGSFIHMMRLFVSSSNHVRDALLECTFKSFGNGKKSLGLLIMRPSIFQSFVLCRGGLHRGTRRLQYHVSQVSPRANHRGFHSKTSLEAKEILRTNSINGASSKVAKGWPNNCFMITSSRPSITASQAGKLRGATQS
jgi:hypothetical protein